MPFLMGIHSSLMDVSEGGGRREGGRGKSGEKWGERGKSGEKVGGEGEEWGKWGERWRSGKKGGGIFVATCTKQTTACTGTHILYIGGELREYM